METRPHPLPQLLNPQRNQSAVFICNTNHIGDFPDGQQVQHLLGKFLLKSPDELKRYPHTGKVGKRVATPRVTGVNNGGYFRQFCGQFVVIRDYNIDTLGNGGFNHLLATHPVIHRDNQFSPVSNDSIVSGLVRPIAILKAVGNIVVNIGTDTVQGFIHHSSAGNTIRVVVTINRNLFAIGNRCFNPLDCLIHIMKQPGIMNSR